MHGHAILGSNEQTMKMPKMDRAQNCVKFGGSIENVILGRIHDDESCLAIQFLSQTEKQCESQK